MQRTAAATPKHESSRDLCAAFAPETTYMRLAYAEAVAAIKYCTMCTIRVALAEGLHDDTKKLPSGLVF